MLGTAKIFVCLFIFVFYYICNDGFNDTEKVNPRSV